MNRRATALREDAEQWRYAYNPRGEVTNGVKARGVGQEAALRTGLQFGYGYDLIGNRVSESVDAPGGAQSLAWSANAANQIEQRETPDARWVLGRAHPEAALAVTGGAAAVREGAEFAVPVTMTDAEQSEWREVAITASREGVGRNGGDVSQTKEGKLWLPASPEAFTYDEDGNLTSDARWLYTWDAENRLVAMEEKIIANASPAMTPPARKRLEFAYDHQHRRVRKVVKSWNEGIQAFELASDRRYLYDDWNLIAEFDMNAQTSTLELVRSYAWGLDLSGTEQGAGGVGGLLLVHQPDSVLAPCYDPNGNITAYVDCATGKTTHAFEYDPFGAEIGLDALLTASANAGSPEAPAFRFSTKYTDAETSLVYYGYRYYAPELGRWLNRDPIGERGGINLYGFVENRVGVTVDRLGLHTQNFTQPVQLHWKETRNGGFVNASGYHSYNYDVFISKVALVNYTCDSSGETPILNIKDTIWQDGTASIIGGGFSIFFINISGADILTYSIGNIQYDLKSGCQEAEVTVRFGINLNMTASISNKFLGFETSPLSVDDTLAEKTVVVKCCKCK